MGDSVFFSQFGDMILPGTKYKTSTNLTVDGTFHFQKPLSLGFKLEIEAETEFSICLGTDPGDRFIQAWLADPTVYESRIEDLKLYKTSPYYASYSITLLREDIEEKCFPTTDFGTAIYFYSLVDPCWEFSNFSGHGFESDGRYYPTVEHFYQSRKFVNEHYAEKVRLAKTPKDASIMGKTRQEPILENWDEEKSDIMFWGVKLKFDTHPELIKLLSDTGERLLIENSPYDNYWGIGSMGNGYNHLGTILMRVRQYL